MEKAGILEREEEAWHLQPAAGPGGWILASLRPQTGQIVRQTLREEVGETVNLVIQRDAGMFYLDRVETDWPFRVQLSIS